MVPLQPDDPERVGNYRLLARIGTGGMGVVYLARTAGGRAVAVKVVRARFAADAQFRARFRREVAAARMVTGVSTAVVLDADPAADQPWLATAYLPGMTLREAVRTVGPLPPATLRVLAAAMAEALVDIHRVGLAHRDLKPANVIVSDDGVRVIDFGIARPEDATAITRVGTVVGTPGFMSPEQVTGAPVGPPSDVFSFGSVLVFAATGREPFGGDLGVTLHRVRTVDVDLDALTEPWLRDLAGACLRADPGARPTAADLLNRFDHDVVDAGWLPPVLSEEIDRRTAQLTAHHATRADTAVPDTDPVTGATIEPPAATGPAPSPTRRRVLIGGAAVLTCVTLGLAWERGRDRTDRAAPPTGPTAPPTPPVPAGPTPAPERWRATVSDYFPSALYAVPGVVLANTGEQQLVAVDAATGRELWRHQATLAGAAAGGLVFEAQSINPALTLIDATTGATRWASPIRPPSIPGHIAVNGGVVCYGFNELSAVAAGDGRPLWTATVDAERGLHVVADLFIAATEAAVVAVDASTGRVRWRFAVDNLQEISAEAGLVFVVDGRLRDLHVLRAADGTTAWEKPGFIGSCGPRVRDSVVYAAGGRGEIFALDPATGAEIWSRAIDQSADLEISGDTICAVATRNHLFGLHVTDGRLLWTFTADMARDVRIDTGVSTSLDGRFFIGVRTGEVIAVAGA